MPSSGLCTTCDNANDYVKLRPAGVGLLSTLAVALVAFLAFNSRPVRAWRQRRKSAKPKMRSRPLSVEGGLRASTWSKMKIFVSFFQVCGALRGGAWAESHVAEVPAAVLVAGAYTTALHATSTPPPSLVPSMQLFSVIVLEYHIEFPPLVTKLVNVFSFINLSPLSLFTLGCRLAFIDQFGRCAPRRSPSNHALARTASLLPMPLLRTPVLLVFCRLPRPCPAPAPRLPLLPTWVPLFTMGVPPPPHSTLNPLPSGHTGPSG